MTLASMKYRLSAIILAAGLLAACGDSDKFDNSAPSEPPQAGTVVEADSSAGDTTPSPERARKLVEMCIAEGASEDVCSCQIKAVEDGLDSSDFDRLVDLAEAGDEDAAQAMLAGIMSNNPHIATEMSHAMLKCATN